MKKIYIIFFLAFVVPATAFSQKTQGKIQGTLTDSTSGSGLYDATVSVISAADSSLVSFTLSSSSGFFEIKNLSTGNYVLLVTYQGFRSLKKPFVVSEQEPVADLGTIKMDRQYKTLDEVVIMEAPVKIKGDTIAYNADAFKTKPNAVAEDLLKKLPGVTVDKDGTIKAQGENVQKVYVDGKEFFGNDPKLATKNLAADMISEVEVYDDMSDQAKFNKIDDGSRSKAINLKLKKEKKRGLFGQASAGYGTDDRYTANFRSNFFKGATQLAVFGNANNGNRQGFTTTDMLGTSTMSMGGMGGGMMVGGSRVTMGGGGMSMPSGGGGFGGGGSGITSTWSGGVNYSDTWSSKFDFTGSYNINGSTNDNIRNSYRQTFLKDSTINRNQDLVSKNINDVNRANIRLTYTMDELNSIIYSSNISHQKSDVTRGDSTTSFVTKLADQYRISESRSTLVNAGDALSWNNNIIWRKKFRKAGRTFSLNLSNSISSNEFGGFNTQLISDYAATGGKLRDTRFDQKTGRDGSNNNYNVNMSYTEPIGRDKLWELNYAYSNNLNASDNDVFNYNNVTGAYDLYDTNLSNQFENLNSYNRVGTNMRVVKKKYNYQLGAALQRTTLESNNISKSTFMDQTYNNILTNASFNYNFMRSKNLRFDYRGRTNQPSIYQLQPLRNISNAPYYYEGNPGLKQEFTNNFSLNYRFFDPVKMMNLFAIVSYTTTNDKIVNNTQFLGFGSQLTKPENVDGVYSVNGNFNFGVPIQKLKGGNFNTTTRVNYNRDISLIDGAKNFIKNLTVGEDLRLNYNFKNKLDLTAIASINYTSASYSIQAERNMNYYTHYYSFDANWMMPAGFILSSDLDFTANTGRSDGYNQSFTMWNASFAKQLFKNKRGEIRLSVFDLLNQNTSLVRNVTDNYVEDVRTNVLKRYFMLSFTLNFNRMGGKSIGGGQVQEGHIMMR